MLLPPTHPHRLITHTTKAVSHTHKFGVSSTITKKIQTKEVNYQNKQTREQFTLQSSRVITSHILGIYYITHTRFL